MAESSLTHRLASPIIREIRSTWAKIVAARAELLTAGAMVSGWMLVTYGVVVLTAPIAWAFSLGVLLLSLAGWRLLWRIVSDGLYDLTRGARNGQ